MKSLQDPIVRASPSPGLMHNIMSAEHGTVEIEMFGGSRPQWTSVSQLAR